MTIGDRKVSLSEAISRNIAPGSTAGLPGLVLPAGLTVNRAAGIAGVRWSVGTGPGELLHLGLGVEAVLGHLPPPKV